MLNILSNFLRKYFFILLVSITNIVIADNFSTNVYNNHGVVGLINAPTARFFDEGAHGLTLYDGTPDQKMVLTASPFDWLEASVF